MSKNIKNNIIKKIESKELTARPQWVFALGSALSAIGLVLSTALAILSIQLLRFRLTHPGIGAARKLNFILSSLPWYIPVLAIAGLLGGYLLLKRYDFSYRKNFGVIAAIIFLSIIGSSYLLSRLGFDDFMSRRGYFRQIYGGEQGMGQMNSGARGQGQVKGRMSR